MITLTRTSATADGIFGTLSQDGSQLCVTLEHAYQQPDGSYAPKIPPGEYTCVFGQHELHTGPIETFEVTNVPGHTGVLIHPGNYNNDSEGCILVGYAISGDMITESRATWTGLMQHIGTDNFTLQVTGSI